MSNGANSALTNIGVMDKLDYITSNWGLPIGAATISLVAGWLLTREVQARELELSENNPFFQIWHYSVKYVCPILVLVVFLFKMEVF